MAKVKVIKNCMIAHGCLSQPRAYRRGATFNLSDSEAKRERDDGNVKIIYLDMPEEPVPVKQGKRESSVRKQDHESFWSRVFGG